MGVLSLSFAPVREKLNTYIRFQPRSGSKSYQGHCFLYLPIHHSIRRLWPHDFARQNRIIFPPTEANGATRDLQKTLSNSRAIIIDRCLTHWSRSTHALLRSGQNSDERPYTPRKLDQVYTHICQRFGEGVAHPPIG